MSEHLKCDAEGCDHVEEVGAITEDMIGKPCPKCGSNLLTRADWDAWNASIRPAIRLAKELGLVEDGQGRGELRIGFHDGELRVKTPSPKAEERQ